MTNNNDAMMALRELRTFERDDGYSILGDHCAEVVLAAIHAGKIPGIGDIASAQRAAEEARKQAILEASHYFTHLEERDRAIAERDSALRQKDLAVKAEAEASECLLLAKGELEAIRNTPPANEGTNICGHNRYWISHFGRCMACERDRAEMREASALADLAEARGLLTSGADAARALAQHHEAKSRGDDRADQLAEKWRYVAKDITAFLTTPTSEKDSQ